MVQITDLKACFIRWSERVEEYSVVDGDPDTWCDRGCPTKQVTGPRVYTTKVKTLAEAQGVMFAYPLCYKNNGNSLVGTHYVQVAFEGRDIPDHLGTHNSKDEPVRWQVSGTGLNDLTTKPSILLEGGCNWHGFITNGDAE